MLIIYGSNISTPANKVQFAANALGLEYRYQKIDLRQGEHATETHGKRHPAHKIPVIEDDGFTLFESGAIVRYLADKKESTLYPKELRARALIDQWMDFASLHIGSNVGKLFYNRIIAPKIGDSIDERSVKDGEKFLRRYLPIIEERLDAKPYMSGETLTLADTTLLAALDPCEISGIDLAPYPAITRWRSKLKQMDFYTRCFKDYSEQFRKA